jgi:hypothetical protein
MTVSPPVQIDQVERKVASLRASGFSEKVLRRACHEVERQQLPLRDAIVLREAKRLAEMQSPAEVEGWAQAKKRVRASVPESTYLLWIDPVDVFGAEGDALVLEAPESVRGWTERRYSHLICEALEAAGSQFTKVRFVSGGER